MDWTAAREESRPRAWRASPQEVCLLATTTDKQLADNGGFIGGLAWGDAPVPAFSYRLRLSHGHVVGGAFGLP